MARHQQGRRPESAPARAPASGQPPAQSSAPAAGKQKRRPGAFGQTGRSGLVMRTKFDTSHIVPIFRTELNEWQRKAWTLMGDRRITLLLGPAGTAKTHCAVARAMHELVAEQTVGKFILIRPAVEAGERLGYLPGDLKQKLDPYFRPIYDIVDDLVGSKGTLREQVAACMEEAPVGFLRGRTFKDAVVVLDEAQNCTWKQLKLVMTRLGKGARMIVTGDPGQTDLPFGGYNPLARLCDNIRRKGIEGQGDIACFEFPERAIVRDDVVLQVLDAFDDGMGDDDVPAPRTDTADEDIPVPSYGKKT